MSKRNENLIKAFIKEVWNENKPEKIPNYIDKRYVAHLLRTHKKLRGIDGVRHNVITSHKNSKNFKIIINNIFSEKSKVKLKELLPGNWLKEKT